jgi:hypothetical protein
MITNDLDSTSQQIWAAYRARANDESIIKDLKEGYGFKTFNFKNFWATEAVLTMIGLDCWAVGVVKRCYAYLYKRRK